jgi:hypothetical protein
MMDKTLILNELNDNGYFIIENYWSEDKCDSLVNEIKKSLPNGFVKTNTSNGAGGDYRMSQSENRFKSCKEFHGDTFLSEMGDKYIGHPHNKKRCQIGVVDSKNSTNSGGGWHVDNHNKQFKAIIYLTDVNMDNGNFAIVEDSRNLIKEIGTYKNFAEDTSETRVTEEKVYEYFDSERIKNITGNKGTLILVDTSNIHRGTNIKEGVRYTLTNYYYH